MPKPKKVTGNLPSKGKSTSLVPFKQASIETMLNATKRANAANKSTAFYSVPFGNLGDSVERRFTGYGGDFLGGGPDYFQGSLGAQGTYPSLSYGNFYGTGQGFGPYSRFGPWLPGGMGGGFQYLKRFSGSAAFSHAVIAACILAYLGYGVVRNIIDLYADFALENIEIIHEDKSVREFYQAWQKKVKLKDRVHRIFIDMFLTANVFIHRKWAKLTPKDQKALRRLKGQIIQINDTLYIETKDGLHKIDPSVEKIASYIAANKTIKYIKADDTESPVNDEDPDNTEKMIPWGYTSLNPLQIELRGSRFKDDQYWILALDKVDTSDVLKTYGYSSYKELGRTDSLPEEFRDKIQTYQGAGAGYVAEIKLDSEDLTIIQDRKPDYWDWAVPFVFPALRALSFKDCLRNMEMRACESVINSIFLFKLGNLEKGMPAEDDHFERLADMLQTPGQAMHIIWNEAIEAEVIQPNVSQLFDPRKHESADKDILTALGVPEVLIGGKGGNYSNSYVSVATVLEKIEAVRDKVGDWILGELKIIADAMGFRRLPRIRFGQTNLRDKNAERTLMVQLFDRGILSGETLLREFNTNIEDETYKQKEEKQIADSTGVGVMDKRGPYMKPEEMMKDGVIPPGWDKEHDISKKQDQKNQMQFDNQMALKQAGTSPQTPNGRPGNSKEVMPRGPQSKPRGPKGLAKYDELLETGRNILDILETKLSNRLLKARGLRYVKQCPQEERERLEGLVYNIFSHMPAAPEQFNTDDFLINILKNDSITAKMKASVLATYHDKIARYEEKFGKAPDRERRRALIVSAWSQEAINNIGLIE